MNLDCIGSFAILRERKSRCAIRREAKIAACLVGRFLRDFTISLYFNSHPPSRGCNLTSICGSVGLRVFVYYLLILLYVTHSHIIVTVTIIVRDIMIDVYKIYVLNIRVYIHVRMYITKMIERLEPSRQARRDRSETIARSINDRVNDST